MVVRPPLPPVFVAYRESDAKAYAIAVRDVLEEAFGEEAVFLDKDTLAAGAWAPQLDAGVAGCRVFVLVMGRAWLDARTDSGERRLDRADDVHRHEIALALATQGVTVLPLLVDGATLPTAEQLPAELRPLAAQQAYRWDDSARRRAVDRLRLLAAVEQLAGLSAATSRPRRPWLIPTAIALALTAAAATASSMASMQLGPTELVIVLVVALCASFGGRLLWQRVGGRA